MHWKATVGVCALLCSLSSAAFAQSFTSTDVGSVGAAGTASQTTAATWTVSGSGADIWGMADAFQFAHQQGPNNGSITARVDDLTAADTFAKAGLMLRGSLDANAAAVILDLKPNGWVEFMSRAHAGDPMQYITGRQMSFPAYLSLAWQGATVTASTSADGLSWSQLGSTGVIMPTPTPEVGMAVTSHNNSALATAHFSFTTVQQLQMAGWNTVDIGDVGLVGSAAETSGRWDISGAGGDVWGQHDGFRYVYRRTRGNNQHLVVRIDSLTDTSPYAKAGLMIRNGNRDDAATVLFDVRPGGQLEFMMRPGTGGDMQFLGTATVTFPLWLQLTWTGAYDDWTNTNVAASYSTNHVQWTNVGNGSHPFSMADSYDAGAFVSSHDRTKRATSPMWGLSLLPSDYWGDDIGNTGLIGNASDDRFSETAVIAQVEAAGKDIWGNADSFYFVHQVIDPWPSSYLGQRVDLQASHPYAKAGLMYRDGLDPDAPMVIVDLKPDGWVEFMARLCKGCPVTFLKAAYTGTPAFLALYRNGADFHATALDAHYSGRVELGTVTVPMTTPTPGYAVTSHDDSNMATAVFDDPPM